MAEGNILPKIHMKTLMTIVWFCCAFNIMAAGKASSEIIFLDKFEDINEWEFISDGVMGGVSTGELTHEKSEDGAMAIMTGSVSTENRGGFIQIKRDVRELDLSEAKTLKFLASGNNQKYYVHLRTTAMFFPWQYYKIDVNLNSDFDEFALSISDFQRSGALVPKAIDPKSIISVAIVAYGRDHNVEVRIRKMSFER